MSSVDAAGDALRLPGSAVATGSAHVPKDVMEAKDVTEARR